MKHQFNIASLAKLTKAELQALLATYQAKLFSAASEHVQSELHAKISMIKSALTCK